MAGQSRTTTNHEKIKKWVEERGGRPAHVKATAGKNDPGLLRIDFPAFGGRRESLEEISWDDFFRKFDEQKLAFLFQDELSSGKESRFFKLIRREPAKKAA